MQLTRLLALSPPFGDTQYVVLRFDECRLGTPVDAGLDYEPDLAWYYEECREGTPVETLDYSVTETGYFDDCLQV